MNTNIGLKIWQTVRGRASALFAFLYSERRHRAIRETERCDLELTLVVGIVWLMLSLHVFRHTGVNVVLNLFFLPVVVSAFYLGRRRAWLAAMLSIFAAVFVFVASDRTIDYLELGSWSAVLVVSAWCVGTLSDELNSRFKEAIDAHVSETRTDALTNIANRRSFDDVLAKQIEMWKAAGTPFCLAIADIDHFKRLNDNYGHQAGDKMLHDVARSLETTIRKTDIVARYGGEEFAIVMPNTTGQEAVEIAERVRADIEATRFFHHRAKLRLTISVGVSQVIGDDGPQAIIQRSDEALYASKQAGRNRTHLQNCEGCIPFGESDATSTDSPDRQTSTPAQAVSNSILDPITHLPKREIFLNELSRRACELERYGYEFAVGIVRLQSYDSLVALGPTALNRSLNIISELIRGVVRDPDLVVRYNSDTFAILMPATTADRGKEALNRVQTEIANCDSFRHRGKVIELRADTAVSQPQGKSATNVIGRLMSGIERLPADAECV